MFNRSFSIIALAIILVANVCGYTLAQSKLNFRANPNSKPNTNLSKDTSANAKEAVRNIGNLEIDLEAIELGGLELRSSPLSYSEQIDLVLLKNNQILRDLKILKQKPFPHRGGKGRMALSLSDFALEEEGQATMQGNQYGILEVFGFQNRAQLEESVLDGLPGHAKYLEAMLTNSELDPKKKIVFGEFYVKSILDVLFSANLPSGDNSENESTSEKTERLRILDRRLGNNVATIATLQKALEYLRLRDVLRAESTLQAISKENASDSRGINDMLMKLRDQLSQIIVMDKAFRKANFHFDESMAAGISRLYKDSHDSVDRFKMRMANSLFLSEHSGQAIEWLPIRCEHTSALKLRESIEQKLLNPTAKYEGNDVATGARSQRVDLFSHEIDILGDALDQSQLLIVTELLAVRAIAWRESSKLN